MSSKSYAAVVLFLSLNILFISLATAKTTCSCSIPPPHSKPKPIPPPHSKPKPTPPPHSKPKPTPPPHNKPKPTPCPPPPTPSTPSPKPTPPSTPTPTPKPTPPSTPTTPTPIPTPPTPPSSDSCPIDTLKLGVCGDLLGGLVNIIVGTPPNSQPCCSLIQGIADLDAAVCLCTALKANVLGINLNVPISLSLLLNTCGKTAPSGFQCRSS